MVKFDLLLSLLLNHELHTYVKVACNRHPCEFATVLFIENKKIIYSKIN